VFALRTDGSGFTNLPTFSPLDTTTFTNIDGNGPLAALVSGNTLYGTAGEGGALGRGTIFAVNTDGTGFSVLRSFNGTSDGGHPSGLLLSGNTLYGTAVYGGSSNVGTVFALSTNGSGFAVLHSFTIDGYSPHGSLILSSNTLYGTTSMGGSSDNGTVFALNVDGTGFRTLYRFPATSGYPDYTNSGGAWPDAGLILSGNTLYGVTTEGGTGGSGTVFSLNTDSTGFTTLHNFTTTRNFVWDTGGGPVYSATNSDGAFPFGELILWNNTLYGATPRGGASLRGTLFAVNTDGTGFTVLHTFSDASEGRGGELAFSGNTLYGTAPGSVYSFSFSPKPEMSVSGSSVILSWPPNYAGFDYSGYALQSATSLTSLVWTTNLPAPVVVKGQYTVTTPISGTQQFFRLSQ
jgi:uncharacterized repeat protein (TIGR03803 family)